MDRFELRLSPRRRDPDAPRPGPPLPLLGTIAVVCGVGAVFAPLGGFLVPLSVLFSVAALMAGQLLLGLSGLFLSVMGVVTSPVLMGALGLGAAAVILPQMF